MRPISRRGWLIAGTLAVGALVAWRTAAAADRERRRQLAHGQIRPVVSEWKQVGAWRLHARVTLPPQPSYSPPVVMIHGLGMSSAYFVPPAERLGNRFTVYAPDLPGHGKSDTPRRALDIPRLADALIAWMDAMRIERACLVGNSMGCQVAVDAAVRHPMRVDRLVLLGPTPDPAARGTVRFLARLLLGTAAERTSLYWILAKDYARMRTRLLAELRHMLRDRIEEKLPYVVVPTMLLRGEKDSVVSQRWLEEAALLARTDRVAVIPGGGHAVHYSAPQNVVEAVMPFLLEGWYNFDKAAAGSRTHPQPGL